MEMSFDDLIRYFSRPMYNDFREYIFRVMRSHPEIREPFLLEAAGGFMQDAADGDVDLSPEDALTLARHEKKPDTDALAAKLHAIGFHTAQDILDAVAMLDAPEPFHGEEKNPDAVIRIYLLRMQGQELNKQPGCILMGLPKFDPEDNTAQLIVAVTEPELPREAQLLIAKLRLNASRSTFSEKNGVAWLQFFVDNCWLT